MRLLVELQLTGELILRELGLQDSSAFLWLPVCKYSLYIGHPCLSLEQEGRVHNQCPHLKGHELTLLDLASHVHTVSLPSGPTSHQNWTSHLPAPTALTSPSPAQLSLRLWKKSFRGQGLHYLRSLTKLLKSTWVVASSTQGCGALCREGLPKVRMLHCAASFSVSSVRQRSLSLGGWDAQAQRLVDLSSLSKHIPCASFLMPTPLLSSCQCSGIRPKKWVTEVWRSDSRAQWERYCPLGEHFEIWGVFTSKRMGVLLAFSGWGQGCWSPCHVQHVPEHHKHCYASHTTF